jgi:hypothetical protein
MSYSKMTFAYTGQKGQPDDLSASPFGRNGVHSDDMLVLWAGTHQRCLMDRRCRLGYRSAALFSLQNNDDIKKRQGLAHPCIALEEDYILPDINGGSHMFVSFKEKDGTWGRAINLAKHGFDATAGGATIKLDGKYLFFHLNEDLRPVDIEITERLRSGE